MVCGVFASKTKIISQIFKLDCLIGWWGRRWLAGEPVNRLTSELVNWQNRRSLWQRRFLIRALRISAGR